MGTLLNQPPRKSFKFDDITMDDLIVDIRKIEKEMNISTESAIKLMEVFELRRQNNLQFVDNDIKDEQLSGFGEVLLRIASALESDEE